MCVCVHGLSVYICMQVFMFSVCSVCACSGVCMDVCTDVFMWSFSVLTAWLQINTLRLILIINA